VASAATFAIRVETKALLRDLAAVDRAVDRATMWTVREAGRKVKSAARRKAPVYKGPPRTVNAGGTPVPLVPGALKSSIASSKRLRRDGAAVSVKVGPRGGLVHLYAPAQEARYGFMAAGLAAATAAAATAAEKAWGRAVRKL
jgi:hypothetical protein